MSPVPDSGDVLAPVPSMRELFWYFLELGWLAFGGPVGQIGLMHLECVERRRWISEEEFVRVLNFCHVLPGPEATQMAIYLGYRKRGYLAGVMAGAALWGATCAAFWLFLPSFVFVLAGARHIDALTSRPGIKEFLGGVAPGVVGLMASVSVLLARVAFMPAGHVDGLTLVLGLGAFALPSFWKWRLNVVIVVLAGGVLGLPRAFVPALFGGAES